jgi:hypothetical protein
LSDAAFHETVIDVVVAPVRTSEPGWLGAVVSPPLAHALVDAEIVLRLERFPATS